VARSCDQRQNTVGHVISASVAGFRASILESDVVQKSDDLAGLMNHPGMDDWSITLPRYVLLHAEQTESVELARR
jgi:phosphate transport system substrate-binding protein